MNIKEIFFELIKEAKDGKVLIDNDYYYVGFNTNINDEIIEYNEDNTRLTVTPAKGYYEIIASTKTSGFNLKDAWEARCEKTGEEVLDGINLGIKRRAQADLAISSDLNEVNIAINTGTDIYENTYTYAKRNIDEDENTFGVDIKFGTDAGSYSARGLNLYRKVEKNA